MTIRPNDPTNTDHISSFSRRPIALTVLGWLWCTFGALGIFFGLSALQFVQSAIHSVYYLDVMPIVILGICIILGMGIIYLVIGYGVLKGRRWGWKTAVGISLLSISFGIVMIYPVIVATPSLGNILSVFPILLYTPLARSLSLSLVLIIAKPAFIVVGVVLLALTMKKSVREYFKAEYEHGRNKISARILTIAAVVMGITVATIGYGYATGLFGLEYTDDGKNSTAPATNEWSIAANLPTPRHELRAAAIGDKIYAVGGFTTSPSSNTNSLEIYDVETNTWSRGKELPMKLDHVGIDSYQGKLYVVGGFAEHFPVPQTPTNTLFIYDPVTDEWTRGADMPTRRGALTAKFVNGILYAVGGLDHIALPVNEAYDPRTNTWTIKAPMPTPREHLASGVVDGKLYVMGGIQGSELTILDVNEEYDPISDKWITKAPMPSRRGSIDAASLSDSIYIFCGEGFTRTFSSNEQYVPSLDMWIIREDMPTARAGCAVAEVEGSIYVLGGNLVPPYTAFSPSGDNEVFTPVDWTLIGKGDS
jgi:N-acetylneuraminic acid mutarotase